MSKFQLVILGIFIVCIIAGVAAFAMFKGGGSNTALPMITVWGTFPKDVFERYVETVNNTSLNALQITYIQETPSTFSQDFVSSLARRQGPDIILITSDMILPHRDKLGLIPYTVITQRDFINTYIREAGQYISTNGLLAMPFMVDPLVMYWNRDMYDSAGLATFPRYWSDFTTINKTLTVKDSNGNISKSAIALGQFSNVDNAREILGTMFMQLGNPVTGPDTAGVTVSTMVNPEKADLTPALTYFTQFTNPVSSSYSWNRTQKSSKLAFLAGTLATYFGFASELNDLRTKNPNINFDVASIPQRSTEGGVKSTYGRLYGLSLVGSSQNLNAALQVIMKLTDPNNLATLSESMIMPSVRRDIINAGSKNPYVTAFNDSALVANSWLDADPIRSRTLFSNMVESLVSGQKSVRQAIQDTSDQYNVLLRQVQQQ